MQLQQIQPKYKPFTRMSAKYESYTPYYPMQDVPKPMLHTYPERKAKTNIRLELQRINDYVYIYKAHNTKNKQLKKQLKTKQLNIQTCNTKNQKNPKTTRKNKTNPKSTPEKITHPPKLQLFCKPIKNSTAKLSKHN